jgi:ABC-type polysaccharide/polyol phosphate transport system ATPase subunit
MAIGSIKNVNMVIKSGEKVACVGKNGMGKSTLIKIIARKLNMKEL